LRFAIFIYCELWSVVQDMLLNLFELVLEDSTDIQARLIHEAKPKSRLFEESPNKLFSSANSHRKKSFLQVTNLEKAIEEVIANHNYPNRIQKDLILFAHKLSMNSRLFPDLDAMNIWYTDHYDLLKYAGKLGMGDSRLPHYPEEPNANFRYLELSTSEIVEIFIIIMNILIDEEEMDPSCSLDINWDDEFESFTNNST